MCVRGGRSSVTASVHSQVCHAHSPHYTVPRFAAGAQGGSQRPKLGRVAKDSPARKPLHDTNRAPAHACPRRIAVTEHASARHGDAPGQCSSTVLPNAEFAHRNREAAHAAAAFLTPARPRHPSLASPRSPSGQGRVSPQMFARRPRQMAQACRWTRPSCWCTACARACAKGVSRGSWPCAQASLARGRRAEPGIAI